VPVEALAYTYTSQDEIENQLSEIGVQLRLRDLTGIDSANYITRLVGEATDVVNQYVMGFYDEDVLANSLWVRAHATWIACVLICRRRGQPVPKSLIEQYNEVIEDLKAVRRGEIQIPRLPTSSNMLPAMSNLRVDDRFYSRKIRVNPSISAGGSSGDQDVDWWWSYDLF
jgi:hypothetical protein